MGYDLHITRARRWDDNADAEIGADEWLALVQADPELTIEPDQGPFFARWSGPSRHDDPWLDWSAGNIDTKNPDSALRRKMVAVAERLGARVQGNEGEFYDGTEPLDDYHAHAQQYEPPAPAEARPWWRRLLGG